MSRSLGQLLLVVENFFDVRTRLKLTGGSACATGNWCTLCSMSTFAAHSLLILPHQQQLAQPIWRHPKCTNSAIKIHASSQISALVEINQEPSQTPTAPILHSRSTTYSANCSFCTPRGAGARSVLRYFLLYLGYEVVPYTQQQQGRPVTSSRVHLCRCICDDVGDPGPTVVETTERLCSLDTAKMNIGRACISRAW